MQILYLHSATAWEGLEHLWVLVSTGLLGRRAALA